ncbi:MAG: glycosyltransferase family protein [Solirubrobacteraceae bacterium]
MQSQEPQDHSLSEQLERTRRELDRERWRARALQTEASLLRTGLATVKADLERIDRSRAWRWGHGAAMLLARLTRRRLRTGGAVAGALERIARLEEALGTRLPSSGRDSPLPAAPRPPQRGDPLILGEEVRRRLGDPPALGHEPLVSIIVTTHNGLALMQGLLAGLLRRTDYGAIELVVVDNASSDGTREWLTSQQVPFPVQVEVNSENRSFAEASNQGAAAARGELLLFINNDVEPIEGEWLRELVGCLSTGAAAVGARLIHSAVTDRAAPSGWIAQHRGIRFRTDPTGSRPYNAGDGEDAFGPGFGAEEEYPAATAACLLVRRDVFEATGGFAGDYRYGTEDVDLALRLMSTGERIRCTGRAVLLHRESSSQDLAGRELARLNRLYNRTTFLHRWAPQLRRELRLDRLTGGDVWSEDGPHVAITVTSADPADGWGDWYTAHEIGMALEELGWRVMYAERRGERWYELPSNVDYVLTLLDGFDARRVDPGIVMVAWIRNWADRWLERPWFNRLDVLLASSSAAAALIQDATGRPVVTFPLATNPARFTPEELAVEPELDYVYTGNRWGEERPIEQALAPGPDERVAVYGRGWDDVPAVKPHARGVAAYDDLPVIYRSAKLVIDDRASGKLSYGAMNARVFDALASGTPVVTDCAAAARELFGDDFPVWDSPASLRAALDGLLADEERRTSLAARFRQEILRSHTYEHRARQLVELLREAEARLSFCIKVAAPSWEEAEWWGDLHFARALGAELQRRGHRSAIQVLPEWEELPGYSYDVAIVLRGLSRHMPKPGQLNVLWNISHPRDLTGAECDGYDLVCIASVSFAEKLRGRTSTPVMVLEQATDPRVFFPAPRDDLRHELVFVGNSRNVRRKILDDLLPTSRDLAVYGGRWDGLIEPRHVVAEHIPNGELRHVYSSAGLVLNDHWEDMRAEGFISNRLYDAVACGAVVVSDRVEGLAEQFGTAVVHYDTPEELRTTVDRLLADPDERSRRGRDGRARVLAGHTFAHRLDRLLEAVDERIDALGHPTRVVGARRIRRGRA